MAQRDSLDKIVTAYFAAVNAAPFTYKGKEYGVKTLTVSPALLRGYTCPEACGGCCTIFSLDYLPSEPLPPNDNLHLRFVTMTVAGQARSVDVWTDWQHSRSTEARHCQHLGLAGRCGIHGVHPFSCDFELARFFHSSDKVRLATQLYGRGWNMLRVDGVRGAKCEIVAPDADTVPEIVRKLRRLAQWCEHFGIPHRVAPIIDWAQSNPTAALVLQHNPRPGFF